MHKREKTTNVTTKRAAAGVRDIINACSTSLRMCSGVQALMCPILLFQSNYGIVMSLLAVHEVEGGFGHEYITVHCAGRASGE